jgi:two-component system, NarL family, nitrate/nitrite response regulator NarL
VRCLLVDDSVSFIRAARDLLEREGVAIVGVASTLADAIRRADELRPDVALLDVRLGSESGFELARLLAETERSGPDRPAPKMIMISSHSKEDFDDLVAASPALGFLDKSRLSARAIASVLEQGGGSRSGSGTTAST